jgi:signal peptidase I
MGCLAKGARTFSSASHFALTLLCVVGVLLVAAVAVSRPLGYRLLVDHSDSMQPTIAAGDVLLTRMEPAADAAIGDIVTFKDPDGPGKLLTHRVVARRVTGGMYHFETRGDANTGSERWSIAAHGRVGQYVGRLPQVGYAVARMADGGLRVVLILGLGAILASRLILRVWRM